MYIGFKKYSLVDKNHKEPTFLLLCFTLYWNLLFSVKFSVQFFCLSDWNKYIDAVDM